MLRPCCARWMAVARPMPGVRPGDQGDGSVSRHRSDRPTARRTRTIWRCWRVVVRAASHPPQHLQGQVALSFTGLLRQPGAAGLSPAAGYMAPRGAPGRRGSDRPRGGRRAGLGHRGGVGLEGSISTWRIAARHGAGFESSQSGTVRALRVGRTSSQPAGVQSYDARHQQGRMLRGGGQERGPASPTAAGAPRRTR
jgi:hypothetical protein